MISGDMIGWIFSCFPSNLGMLVGIFIGTGGQSRLWKMGSFVTLDKCGNSSISKNGNCVLENGLWFKGNMIFKPY